MTTPKMATFKVSDTDSSRVMFDKLNTYMIEVKKEKYNNVLKLLNELFEQNNKSLRNFIKIDSEYFESKSTSKTIKILDKYKEKLGFDTNKLSEYYANKKANTKATKTVEIKEIIESVKEPVKVNIKAGSKTKTKSDFKTEIFTVSGEVFTIITKLIRPLDYKLVKSSIAGKPHYSLVMNT